MNEDNEIRQSDNVLSINTPVNDTTENEVVPEENNNNALQPLLQTLTATGTGLNVNVQNLPELERSFSQQLGNISTRTKFFIPFILILLLKYLFDNFTSYLLLISIAISFERVKSFLLTQIALKNGSALLLLCYGIVLALTLLVITVKMLPELDYKQRLFDRLSLNFYKSSIPKGLSLFQVIWDCYLTDWIVQMFFLIVKAFLSVIINQRQKFISFLQKVPFLDRVLNRTSVRGSMSSDHEKSSGIHDLENQTPSSSSASNLFRRNSRSQRETSPQQNQVDDDTTDNTSEAEDPQSKISKMRFLSLMDILVYLYRSLLPLPVWLYYLSYEGSSFQAFAVGYFVIKLVDFSWKFKGVIEAIETSLGQKLEFGHYSSPTEYNPQNSTYDCPICFESPRNPVTLDCNHIFCEVCIFEWLDKEKTCPVCRKEIVFQATSLHALKQEVYSTHHLFV